MNQEDRLYNLQQMVKTIPELEEFLKKNDNKDFSKSISLFIQEMKKQNCLSAELDLKLKILLEKINEFLKSSSVECAWYIMAAPFFLASAIIGSLFINTVLICSMS